MVLTHTCTKSRSSESFDAPALVTIFAHPYGQPQVFNSSFEGCFGRYGGAALFLCGGYVEDSTIAGNEASGVFGAVVNGDLSDEERLNASISLAGAVSDGGYYTCPALSISGALFDGNAAVGGYGGGVASVDASLSVFNSSFVGSLGGALYFGSSDLNGRDELNVRTVC